MPQNNTHNTHKIYEEACRWRTREDCSDMTMEEQEKFYQWIAESAKHQEAYIKACNASDLLHSFGGSEGVQSFKEFSADANQFIEECNEISAKKGQKLSLFSHHIDIKTAFTGIAASLLIMFSGLFFMLENNPEAISYGTKVGVIKTVMLKDGSVIKLNTDTQLSVAFSKLERKILLEKGEAHFDVAKNKTRPFIVMIDKNTVEATGTAFNIKKRNQLTKVTVTEGSVEVSYSSPQTAATSPLSLKAGSGAMIDQDKIQAAVLTKREMEQRTAWQTGMIYFDKKKLQDVVTELQYYTKKEILFANNDAKNITVSGFFDMANVSSFLKGLQLTFPVNVIERDTIIILNITQKTAHQIVLSD